MEARQNILLAFGENKAQAIAEAVEGPIQANNPATILQMHPNAKFFLDTQAASRLQRKEYYNWVYSNKPDWQKF
jgi:glucosamine-6-phosphate deaminase